MNEEQLTVALEKKGSASFLTGDSSSAEELV